MFTSAAGSLMLLLLLLIISRLPVARPDEEPPSATSGEQKCDNSPESRWWAQNDLHLSQQAQPVEPQLSRHVRPTFYTLRLKLDPRAKAKPFIGHLMVAIESVAPDEPQVRAQPTPLNYLTLHGHANLRVRSAYLVTTTNTGRPEENTQVEASSIGRNESSELISIGFPPEQSQPLSAGQCSKSSLHVSCFLLIVYAGSISNSSASQGLFSFAAHQQEAGLASHFQPNYARRLLPCWDEPRSKARFQLTIVAPYAQGLHALSNTPVRRRSITLATCSGKPLLEIEFAPTPLMSSYILTLVVGYFSSKLSARTSGGAKPVEVTMYHNHEQLTSRAALDAAVRGLPYLENLFQVGYSLPKLDLVAFKEFQYTAMENWGLLVLSESQVLTDEQAEAADHFASLAQQHLQRHHKPTNQLTVQKIIGHELVHQWFGNLVSPRSWTRLWLSEAFAQLLMYDVGRHLSANHSWWLDYLEDVRLVSMRCDEQRHSRALEIADRELASNPTMLFDEITYNKGAAVLHMIRTCLGPRRWQAGLGQYLSKLAYSTTNVEALYEHLGLQRHQWQTWIFEWGFPLLDVFVYGELGEAKPTSSSTFKLRVEQQRFSLTDMAVLSEPPSSADFADSANDDDDDNHESSRAPLWSVPVTFCTNLEPQPRAEMLQLADEQSGRHSFWLQPKRVQHVTINWRPNSSAAAGPDYDRPLRWLKLNANASGYFRVNYVQERVWRSLGAAAGDRQLNEAERHNLLDDLFACVRAGRHSSRFLLSFVAEYFAGCGQAEPETSALVWRAIVSALRRVRATIVVGDAPEADTEYEPRLQPDADESAGVKPEVPRAEVARAPSDERQSWPEAHFDAYVSAMLRCHNGRQPNVNESSGRHQLSSGGNESVESADLDALLGRARRLADGEWPLAELLNRNQHPQPAESSLEDEQQLADQLLAAYRKATSGAERRLLASSLGELLASAGANKRQSFELKWRRWLNVTASVRYSDMNQLAEPMGRTRVGRQILARTLANGEQVTLLSERMAAPARLSGQQGPNLYLMAVWLPSIRALANGGYAHLKRFDSFLSPAVEAALELQPAHRLAHRRAREQVAGAERWRARDRPPLLAHLAEWHSQGAKLPV